MMRLHLTVNGEPKALEVAPRRLLADVLRRDCGMRGVHIGCAHGACGCCTVLVDGVARLSCLAFAVQCEGAEIVTVEGLGGTEATHPLQRAFMAEHALQCGYCTPGFLMALTPFVEAAVAAGRVPDEAAIRHAISGNLCRCTGYQTIVSAVARAVREGLARGGEHG